MNLLSIDIKHKNVLKINSSRERAKDKLFYISQPVIGLTHMEHIKKINSL